MPFKDPAKAREWARKRYRENAEYREGRKKEASRQPEARHAQYERTKEGLKERNSARSKVRNRVRSKKWASPALFTCTDCSAKAEHYHHENYSQWWNVEPLCQVCHGKRHRL